ncbi:hypothetical protein IMY05_008G0122700 [Salix suchowensis]|nr:hypothetical protein IMY05_008G0122700 [Salix suchowensis]
MESAPIRVPYLLSPHSLYTDSWNWTCLFVLHLALRSYYRSCGLPHFLYSCDYTLRMKFHEMLINHAIYQILLHC